MYDTPPWQDARVVQQPQEVSDFHQMQLPTPEQLREFWEHAKEIQAYLSEEEEIELDPMTIWTLIIIAITLLIIYMS